MADSQTYLPTREADLVTWTTNFEARVAATPTAYGLTAGQATAFTALFNAFITAYNAANAPTTRSPVTIATKNMAKGDMIDGPGGIRALAAIVQAWPSITPTLLSELGLTVRDKELTPIPVPSQSPVIDILAAVGRTVKLRLHDASDPKRNAKPSGVKGAAVFYYVGASAPVEISDWQFYGNTSRTFVDVELPAETPSGATVWFTAFWFNPRLESGPAASPTSTNIPGGVPMAA